jgi:hypothetical protein
MMAEHITPLAFSQGNRAWFMAWRSAQARHIGQSSSISSEAGQKMSDEKSVGLRL